MSGSATDTPLLELASVCHGFGHQDVLRGLSLQLPRGGITVLVGSSGSGKTTLLRLIAGLERPRSGQVRLRGALMADGARGCFVSPEQRRLGMVFQGSALWPHLDVQDNVAIALPPGSGGRRAAAEQLLSEMELGGFGRSRPDTLSGGQKQRVALARALATGTDLLLLDEPLSALDEPLRDRLRTLIRDGVHRRSGSALIVSHDRTDAWRLADRIVVLENGVVSQLGSPHALYAAPATESVARYMGATGRVAVRGTGWGQVGLEDGSRLAVSGPVLAEGQPGRLVVYPEAVRLGAEGVAAVLVDSAFEGGRWRGRWRLTSVDGEVEALHDRSPPDAGALTFDAGGTFVFSTGADHEDQGHDRLPSLPALVRS